MRPISEPRYLKVKNRPAEISLRLTIIQYAGDYREAFDRFARGGKETYHAQRYSVDLVGSLAQRVEQVAVVCAVSESRYDVVLANGVRAIGAGLRHGFRSSQVIPELVNTRPTRLSLTTPMLPILKWADHHRIRTIAPLADSFQKQGLRNAFRNRRLARYLNRPFVEWVGNHGINACLSLLDIGVASEKIVPWDWPASHLPSDHAPRALSDEVAPKLLYVGSVTPEKGVGDLLHAIARLRQSGFGIELSIVGRDPDGTITELARSLGISDLVDFAGVLPNDAIPGAMRTADVVIIPSRHEYPEGLPLTIYEALAARTPIIASDHPMFRGVLIDGETAIIFPAGNPEGLATAIIRLLGDVALYNSLSLRSEATWNSIQLPVTMGRFLEAWISDSPTEAQWLREHSLMSGCYADRLDKRRRRR
jgi:glycosyltransferase involved in cell wall biosynthesis